MIFEFGPCRIDVDVERTRRWYETAPTLSRCCDCDGCVNYERAADRLRESSPGPPSHWICGPTSRGCWKRKIPTRKDRKSVV